MNTRKMFLTMVIVMMAMVCRAQDYLVTPERFLGSEYIQIDMRNIMELRDGGILANVQLFKQTPPYDYGCVFYKIEYDSVGANVSDSLFIEDDDMNYFLLERNPFDDDNVYAKIVRDLTNKRSDLRIQFFDDDLNFKPEKEIWVPISDTLISPLADDYLLDGSGDMVFSYRIKSRRENHVVKMGLDGTEKAHLVFPTNNEMITTGFNIAVFNETPKEYCLIGLYSPSSATNPNASGSDSLRFIVLDSLLNIERTITHNGAPDRYVFDYGWDSFQDYGDTSFLFLTKYDTVRCFPGPDTCYSIYQGYFDGSCLSKCGKSNARNYISKLYPVFSYPMAVKSSNDGNIYLAFYNTASVTVAKLTQELGTIWESTYNKGEQYFTSIVALEKGGMAVGGLNIYYSEDYSSYSLGIFFVIFKDGCFSLPENKTEELPYTFYPNPANDELNLNISPDAEPSVIELYDIQGRMLRSQENNFDRISLHGLPVGTYALRVSMKDGKQYTSAVVKK